MYKVYGLDVTIVSQIMKVFDRKRTFKERFFTLPWRPLLIDMFKDVLVMNDGEVIRNGNKLIMNSKTWKSLEIQIIQQEQSNYIMGPSTLFYNL